MSTPRRLTWAVIGRVATNGTDNRVILEAWEFGAGVFMVRRTEHGTVTEFDTFTTEIQARQFFERQHECSV